LTRKKTHLEKAAAAGAAAAVAAATGDQVLDIEDDDDIDGQEEVFRALRELGTSDDEIVWQVVKMSGPPNQRGFIEKLSTSQLDLQFFRDSYGPGDYRVMGYRGSQYVKGGHRTVKISDVGYKPQPAAAAVPAGGSAADIIAALDKRNEARASELKSWAAILVPVLGPAILKLFERKSEVGELVQGLAALKGLTPDPPKPEGLESQLDRIMGVMEKLKEAQGAQSSTGATWVDIVRDGISALKGPAEALAGRLIAPGLPALPPTPMIVGPAPFGPTSMPTPAPGSGAPLSSAPTSPPGGNGDSSAAAQPPPVQPVMSFLPWLRDNLQALIYQAGRNKDPGLYASVMLDNLPPGTDPALLKGFIERADWWAQLKTFAPGVTPYPAWFEEFREAVLEIMNSPPDEPTPPESPASPPHDGESESFT
jgi:hypothetical protein